MSGATIGILSTLVVTGVAAGFIVRSVVRDVKKLMNMLPCKEATCIGGWREHHENDRMYLVMHDCHPGYREGIRSHGRRVLQPIIR